MLLGNSVGDDVEKALDIVTISLALKPPRML
jgi:hypothetical protein